MARYLDGTTTNAEVLYSSISGSNWYDPVQARTLVPITTVTGNGGTVYTSSQLNSSIADNTEDALLNPGGFGIAGSVSNTDPYHIAQGAGYVSTAAFTLATFGTYTAAASETSWTRGSVERCSRRTSVHCHQGSRLPL